MNIASHEVVHAVNVLKECYEATYSEEYKVLLVVFPDAVVDPGAVVVHLPDAPLTD